MKPSKLRSFEVGTVGRYCRVGDGAHASIGRVATGVMYLSSKNFRSTGLDLSQIDFITEADYEKYFSESKNALTKPKSGDVLLGIIGSLGTPYVVRPSDRFGLSSSVAIIRPGEMLDSFYLYYFMTSSHFQSAVNAIKSGVAQGFLSLAMIRSLPLVVPPLYVQRKIASILSAYDDLIENNKRRIAILEKMAEEIYREWFVRMRFSSYASDFAKATSDKKATDDKPAKKEKGLPAGWRIGIVKDLGRVVTGKTPPTSEVRYYGTKYPFIKTPDMHDSVFVTETSEYLSEDGYAFQRSQQIPERSICVSCIGTAGVVGITTQASQTNQQINTIILNDLTYLEWAYFTVRGLKELMNLFGATGATMTNISKGKFERLPIILPTKEVITFFHKVTAPIFDEILTLTRQVAVLKQTRDLLLPRLISGKLSVEDLDLPSTESASSTGSALPQAELAHA